MTTHSGRHDFTGSANSPDDYCIRCGVKVKDARSMECPLPDADTSDRPWGYKITLVVYVQGHQQFAEAVTENIEEGIGSAAHWLAGTTIEPIQDEPKEQGA